MRWLHHAFTIIPPSHRYTIIHYLDNKSVIKRIEKLPDCIIHPANLILLSKHDIIREIDQTINDLPIDVDTKWTQGHQDARQAYNQLPLPAQLNCDADKAAAEYSHPNTTNYDRISVLPHTPCQFILHEKSVTNHYKSRIRDAITLPEYYEYMKRKYRWDDQALQTIDWSSYSQILK